MAEEIYTIKEVAKILKTNAAFVHQLRKAGLLPCIKLGNYKVRKDALDDFLARYENCDVTDPYNVKHLTA